MNHEDIREGLTPDGDPGQGAGQFLNQLTTAVGRRRRRRRALIAGTCAASVVLVAAGGVGIAEATAGHSTGTRGLSQADTSPSATPCAQEDLAVSGGGVSPGMGTDEYVFTVTNNGSAACSIPSINTSNLAGVQSDGTATGFTAAPMSAASFGYKDAQTLAPGESAQFGLVVGVNCSAGSAPSSSASDGASFPNFRRFRFQFGNDSARTITLPHQETFQTPCGRPGLVGPYVSGASSAAPTGLSSLEVSDSVPQSVSAGSSMDYQVTLENPGTTAVSLDPCPTYTARMVGPGGATGAVTETDSLTCGSVTSIPAGGSETFSLSLTAPAATGTAEFNWMLNGTQPLVDTGGPVTVQ